MWWYSWEIILSNVQIQYCAKVMRAKFIELRSLFSRILRSKFRSKRYVLWNDNSMKIREGKRKFDITIFQSKEISIEIRCNQTKYRWHFKARRVKVNYSGYEWARRYSMFITGKLRLENLHDILFKSADRIPVVCIYSMAFFHEWWGFWKWFAMFLLISDVTSFCSVTTMFTQSCLRCKQQRAREQVSTFFNFAWTKQTALWIVYT